LIVISCPFAVYQRHSCPVLSCPVQLNS
jgi:hypothetical protein